MSDGSTGSSQTGAWSDDDLLPISALQHWVFCPRQCVLIHVERIWTENRHTAEGRLLHDKAHADKTERQGDRLIARGLRLASYRLGLVGVADVVEFLPVDRGQGPPLPGRRGHWQPLPVEYKRGRPKKHNADAVQLCAQALCLEEMLDTDVPAGALFYGKQRRRQEVCLDRPLRDEVARVASQLHEAIAAGLIPPPRSGPHCKTCSLRDDCLPDRPRSVGTYFRNAIRKALEEDYVT